MDGMTCSELFEALVHKGGLEKRSTRLKMLKAYRESREVGLSIEAVAGIAKRHRQRLGLGRGFSARTYYDLEKNHEKNFRSGTFRALREALIEIERDRRRNIHHEESKIARKWGEMENELFLDDSAKEAIFYTRHFARGENGVERLILNGTMSFDRFGRVFYREPLNGSHIAFAGSAYIEEGRRLMIDMDSEIILDKGDSNPIQRSMLRMDNYRDLFDSGVARGVLFGIGVDEMIACSEFFLSKTKFAVTGGPVPCFDFVVGSSSLSAKVRANVWDSSAVFQELGDEVGDNIEILGGKIPNLKNFLRTFFFKFSEIDNRTGVGAKATSLTVYIELTEERTPEDKTSIEDLKVKATGDFFSGLPEGQRVTFDWLDYKAYTFIACGFPIFAKINDVLFVYNYDPISCPDGGFWKVDSKSFKAYWWDAFEKAKNFVKNSNSLTSV
ncbi:MAG: hypothetical protein AAF065_13350 [Verrucomicrobiota bacterium]